MFPKPPSRRPTPRTLSRGTPKRSERLPSLDQVQDLNKSLETESEVGDKSVRSGEDQRKRINDMIEERKKIQSKELRQRVGRIRSGSTNRELFGNEFRILFD